MIKSSKQRFKQSLGLQDKAKLKILIWNIDSDSIKWLYGIVGSQYHHFEKKGLYK